VAILAKQNTHIIVQGITGKEGSFYTRQMILDGSRIVGGVTPGKGGEWIQGKPVFDSVKKAIDATGANATVIFAPAVSATDAIYEAIDAEIALIVCITEGIPALDMMRIKTHLVGSKSRLIGPNCPGILTPHQTNIGIIPTHIATPGNIGVISRSGTLMYDIVSNLTRSGIGQTTCVGVGGDPILGSDFVDILHLFEEDPETEKVLIIGEIGGEAETDAADFIKANMTKAVVAYVAGQNAPPNLIMGHSGAIIENQTSTASHKIEKLLAAGVLVTDDPEQLPHLLSHR
jgi:succinyl-CoA synthetase alpha subunit